MAKQILNDRQTTKETVLFNGSIATSVTISEAYTNFKELRVIWKWVDTYGTVILDTAISGHNFAVVRQGLINSAYRVQIGAATITLSGTTVSGSTAAATYTADVTSTSALTFRDTVGDVQIVRVVGIR